MLIRRLLLLITTTSLALISTTSVSARPRPDKPGVCYYFVDDELKSQSSCVIKTGYGAGGSYEIQDWANGNRVEVQIDHSESTGESGKPDITVNGKPAIRTHRTKSFYNRVQDPQSTPEETMGCYKIKGKKESICSSIKES